MYSLHLSKEKKIHVSDSDLCQLTDRWTLCGCPLTGPWRHLPIGASIGHYIPRGTTSCKHCLRLYDHRIWLLERIKGVLVGFSK